MIFLILSYEYEVSFLLNFGDCLDDPPDDLDDLPDDCLDDPPDDLDDPPDDCLDDLPDDCLDDLPDDRLDDCLDDSFISSFIAVSYFALAFTNAFF